MYSANIRIHIYYLPLWGVEQGSVSTGRDHRRRRVLVGRSGGRFVQRARKPISKPYWSPTHGALGTKVHDAFPPFPPTKKKKDVYRPSREGGVSGSSGSL